MKRFSLLTVVTLCGFAVAGACADPYEGEIPNTEAPVRDAASAEDATSDASVEPGADAADAGADVQADVDPCSDRDKDGFIDRACDGGTDCDDDDRRANPEAGFVRELPTLVTGGDWNCNGSTSFEQPVNVKCSDHVSDSLGNGCALQGFKENPGCGKTGDFVKCKASGLLAPCAEESLMKLVQGCK